MGIESSWEKAAAPKKKKISGLRKIFRLQNKQSVSEMSGSRLSIDYEHFNIVEAPAHTKRFTDSHINPDVSFRNDGFTNLNDLGYPHYPPTENSGEIICIENELYSGSSHSALPITCIDDVDLQSDFSDYEPVNTGRQSI